MIDRTERSCPFCAETIKAEAKVCKHCGRDLPVPEAPCAVCAGKGVNSPLVLTEQKCPVCGAERQGDDVATPCRACARQGRTSQLRPLKLRCPTCGATRRKSVGGGSASGAASAVRVVFGVLGGLILSALAIGYCVLPSGSGSSGGWTSPTPTRSASLEYRVTCSSTQAVSVTYMNAQSGSEQGSRMACPWSQSYPSFSGFAYISAQNQDDYGTLTVEILVNDVVAKKSSCTGAYCIASASGRL